MPDLKHPLTARFTNALALAANIHRLQARRGTQVPYMAHILGVASIALEHAANEDEAIAAVLHDAIEDAPKRLGASGVRGAIAERFGADVLKIVEGCTDTDIQPKPPWRRRKEQYVRRIAHEDASTLLVSASDKLHNVRAILSDFRAEGIDVFNRFNKEAGVDATIGYYRGLVVAFRARNKGLQDPRLPRLLDELDRTVTAIEQEVGVVGKWPPVRRPLSPRDDRAP
jgi:GTP pyrophosphokinase